MATTNKLQDDGPTTTINFDAITKIDDNILADNFHSITIPNNVGVVVVHELQWFRVLKVNIQFKNDITWPTSGDSAADKRIAFQNAIQSGGDNPKHLWNLTYNTEDSDPDGTEQTETLTGKVKSLHRLFKPGEHVAKADMDFEFWVAFE